MSRSFVNTSDHLDSSGVSVSDVPLTIACWFKFVATGQMALVTIGESGTGNNWYVNFISSSVSPRNFQAAERDTVSIGVNAPSQIRNQDTNSLWHLGVGVFNTHSDRTSYADGKSGANNTGARTATGVNTVKLSGDTAAAPTLPLNGKLAHVAIWNAALSAAQVDSLLYLYPNQVQVANLVNYWPLTGNQSPEPDYGSGNLPLTVTGTTFSTDDPNIAGTQVIQLMGGSAS